MGDAGEGQNIAHQKKKVDDDDLKIFRDRFHIPISDEDIAQAVVLQARRRTARRCRYLQGAPREARRLLPAARPTRRPLEVPPLEFFKSQLEGSGDREISTTMAFVRILTALVRDKNIGQQIVPIVPGRSAHLRHGGHVPADRHLFVGRPAVHAAGCGPADRTTARTRRDRCSRRASTKAARICSWIAAGTAYANHGVQMIPFYIYYSMFGFQRIGDFVWAGGDMQARGFLLGGTAGRTTLAGEGLQHQDGHSQLVATTIPNCRAYDPCYTYELAVIIQDGLRRMCEEQENIFYYITLHERELRASGDAGRRARKASCAACIRCGEGGDGKVRVQLLGSGTILREVLAAAELLEQKFGVPADVWSVTSFSELRREALDVERWNTLHPEAEPRDELRRQDCFAGKSGPFVAATDYMKLVSDQIRQWVPGRYVVLGTDGFGRSDGRHALREHFEVDRRSIAIAALKALADDGGIDRGNGRGGDRRVRYRSRETVACHLVRRARYKGLSWTSSYRNSVTLPT